MSSEHISLSWKVIFKINNAYIPFFNNSFFIRRANKRNNVCSSSWNQIIIQTQQQCIYRCNFIYCVGIWSEYGLGIICVLVCIQFFILIPYNSGPKISKTYTILTPAQKFGHFSRTIITYPVWVAAAKFYWQLKKEGEGCQREQVPRKIIPLAVLPDKILEWQRDLT